MLAIFREASSEVRLAWLSEIRKQSPSLALLAKHYEVLYNDLHKLSDASIGALLKSFPEKLWLCAWKLSSPETKKALLKQMSERRQAEFLQAFDQIGRLRRNEVIQIQMRISKKIAEGLTSGSLSLTTYSKS